MVRSHLAYHLRRRRWRSAIGATLVIGLLGGVALAALAGARRTASAHAEYLRSTRASDVLVNTPVPDLERPEAIARLPGVADSANYVGLYGFPVVDGAEAEEFGLTGLFGSVDGRFFEQDRATAEQGRLPAVDATDEIALTQLIADLFGVGLGDALTYVYRRPEDDAELLRATYRVVGIVELPPLLVDDADRLDGALLPPAATARVIETAYYSWQGIRLEEGPDGIDTFVSSLASDPTTDDIPPIVKRVDDITAKVQRAIRPLAVALALFGAAVAVAALVLGAQTLARLVAQWSTDQPTLRAMGAGRGLRASLGSVEAVAAALAGAGSAVAVAAALSPLAPVGSLRTIVPSTGVRFDGLVLGAGGGLLAASLLLAAAATAWRRAAATPARPASPSRLALRVADLGLPLGPTVATSQALDASSGWVTSPLRATLGGGVVATAAVMAAVVFAGNLRQLVDTPARYGWNWDRYVVAGEGYAIIDLPRVRDVLEHEAGVEGWSTLSFSNGVPVDDLDLPTLGIERGRGEVAPPTIRGRLPRGDGEVALGSRTLRRLGKDLGDTVRFGDGPAARPFRVVGTVVLPAIGQVNSDHTALGQGALVETSALATTTNPGAVCGEDDDAVCPSAVSLRLEPDTGGDAVVRRLVATDPANLAEKEVQLAAEIRNAEEIGGLPLALGSVMAVGAALSLGLALTAFVRQQRRQLAILKAVGFTASQVRSSVLWQAALALVVAVAVGLPLGVAGGRWLWARFAADIGVDPAATVPVALVAGAVGALLVVGAASAAVPGVLASRTRPAEVMRQE